MNPMPVDLSKLKGPLSMAKQLLKKVESNDYTTGHVNALALTESGVQQLAESGYVPQQHTATPVYSEDKLANSKMPEAVKQMMRDNPPVAMDMNFAYGLGGLEELIEKPFNVTNPVNKRHNNINESRQSPINNGDMITISKAELNEMINKAVDAKLLEFMTQAFTKNLSETVITKTVSTLIKEGKIQVKKKTT